MNETSVPKAELEKVTQTSPTANMANVLQPMEVKENTPLEDITKHYDNIASNFNAIGENLAKDVDARQNLLIGNDYTNNDGSAIGAYNYQRYYPQPLASGADAISIIGTNKALNTGMKRAQEAAEKRLKAAQDRARRYQQAQAAAAARAAAQQEAIRKQQLSSVKNVNLSTLDLNKLKEKGIEVQDFMRMDPAKRAEALGRATDQASGMTDAYNKGWENKSDPNSLWNKTVQEMYRRFGASGATTDDEFSGPAGQSDENKAFWKRADVSKAFGETYAALAGQGTDYYQRRAEYVGQVNNKIQNVLDHGGKLDEVINALNSVEFKFNTNVSPKNFVSYMASDNFKNIVGNMDRLTHALDGGVAVKDPAYLNQIRAIREAAVASEKDKTGEKGFAEELQKKGISGVDAKNAMEKVSSLFNGLSNTVAVQGTSGQVKSFKDFYKGAYNTDLSSVIEGFSKATDPKYEEKKVSGLTLSRDFLAFDADEMLTLYDWKTKSPKELDNIMNHISMAMYNPIQVSDGSLKDASGKVIPKGEVLFYTVPGTENLAVTKDLKTELANNIAIDENGNPHYTNKEAIDKAYNNYIQSAAIVDSYLNDGKYTDSTDVANIIQYSIANRNGFAIGDYNPYENPEERNAAKELTIKGKKIKDVISDFNKLLDSQREDVALAINELAKGGSNKYSLHGVLDGELTKEDAEALSLLINLNSKSNKSIAGEGSMEGFHDSVLNIAQGAGESFTTSLEGSINFLGSLAKISMSMMNPASLLNGTNNMFTEGLDYIVNGGKSGHKIVDFAQGIRDREEDRADLVNNPRLAQAGIEHTVKDGFRGGGHIAGGIGEFIAESIVTAGIGKLLTTGAKGVTTLGAKTLGSLMAKNSTDDLLAKGIKEVVESTSDDVIRNSLDDIASKGLAKGASLGDEAADASTKMFNKAAKGADDVARSVGDDVAKSSVEKGAEAKNVLDDALNTARKEAIGGLNAKSSVEDIESALSKGLSKFKDDIKGLVEPFLKETSIKAKMYALGLSDDIVKNINKVGMSAFKSISKHMGDDIAKDFAEKAAAFTAKTGKDLTVRDVLRMVGGLEGQGAKAVQVSMRLKDEMRQTLAGMAHSIRSNDQGLQQISPVDDKGNLNLEKPINFLINEGILDLGMGMGLSYVGDAFRMQRLKSQRGYYEGRLDKANKALEYLSPRSEDYTKQMEKIYNLNTKLTNTELELGLEYQMHGNSVKYQELVQTAQKNSDELIKTVSAPWYEEWSSKNGEKTPSIDDMMEILKNKAGAKETSYDFRVAAKMASMFQHRKFTSEMPTLNSMLKGKEWVDVVVEHNNRMAKFYSEGNIKSSWKQNNEMLGDILLEKGYPKAEVETYIKYRNDMDMRASTVLKNQMRRSYYSVASIKNTDLDAPLEYKGNSLAGSAGVPFFTKQRVNVDQVKLFESLQKYYDSGKKIGDGINAGKEMWQGFDERALNPIADLMYINNQWRSREMMGQAREAQFSRGDIIGVLLPDPKSARPVNKKNPSKAELFSAAFKNGKKTDEQLGLGLGFDKADVELVKKLNDKIGSYVKSKGFDAKTQLRFRERFFSDLVSGNGSPVVYKALISASGGVERANEILKKYSSRLSNLDDAFTAYRKNLKATVLKENPHIKGSTKADFNKYIDELAVDSWYHNTNYTPKGMDAILEKVRKDGVTEYPNIKSIVKNISVDKKDLDLRLLDLLDSSISAKKPIDERISDLNKVSDAFSEDTVHVSNGRTTVNLKYTDDDFKAKYTSLSKLIHSANMDPSVDKTSIINAYRNQFMSAKPAVRPNDLYVDNELADIIKASLEAKPGSEQAKFSKAFDKFVDISKNIQQMQLAAGYGVFNAYSGLQIRDVFMSTVTRNPIQAIKILGTYLDARNLDSAQKFFADPNRSAMLLKYTALTGDTKFIDAMSEINSYGPGETNAINRLISGWKDTISQSKANGQKGYGKATGKLLNTLTEDATFMRLIPILQVKHLEFEVNAQTKSWLRKNPGVDLTEDIRNELIKRAGDSVEAFWNPHVGIGKKGNTHLDIKKNEMVYGKNRTKKDSIMDVVDTFVFARLHQQTMVGRVLNGIFSMVNPKRWGDNRYNSARGYAASFLGLVVLAQAWNHITDPHKQDNSSASGFDSNDIVGTLTNLGSVAAFNIPGKSAKLDSMFSTFTMPNRLMRTGVAIANQFKKIEDRDPRVNDIAHEAGSFLLSPYSTAMDIAMGNKYGYSVWGKNAAAIDPDTGEPVDYDPGKDWIAIMSYALGISDRNGRGENISGGGILKHPYIDAMNDLNKYHDPLTSILMGLEVPIKRVNNLGYAKAEFNGNVHDSIRSFYKEYKNASEGASNARKNELYQEFAKKAVERIALWNSRHKVLKDNPQELLAAQRMLMAYLSDEVSEHDKKIMNAYWASGIDKLGGFDKRADETDDQYKERKKITGQAWDLQMAKESKARKTLRELGFDPIGFEYKDIEANRKETKRNLLSQFKAYTEGKTGGGEDLKAVKAQYQDEIAARRNAKDFNGAAQLEKEYINKLDGVLAPYIEKYGKYMLIQNPDFMDIVKPLVMIPQSDSKKYLSDNRARNWLLDRYGIGYRDGSHLIADDKYVSAYNKVLKDLVSGKSSSAGDRINKIIDGVGSGKFQPSTKQYEQLMKIYNNINRR